MVEGKRWSPELEGLRGLASLWVLLGHICLLVQCRIPILYDPGMGVDLFILLSGYLMAKNYQERREKEPWNSPDTFRKFWLRRFFRIAPLYYLLLIVALIFGSWFGEMRDIIASAWPTTATASSRYADHSALNIFSHLTFIFGLLPAYSFRTVLPDWSIGLEMQFYLLFPFIMLLVMRYGFAVSAPLLMVVCLAARWLFPDYFDAFPMPAMILIKLPLFIAGMLISHAVMQRNLRYCALALLAPVIAWQMHIAETHLRLMAECIMLAGMTLLLWQPEKDSRLRRITAAPRRLLTCRFSLFLGDVSYSVYLLHLMIVIPTIGLLVRYTNFAHQPSLIRFLMVTCLVLPVVWLIAVALYHKVEKRGIALGKQLSGRAEMKSGRSVS
ncbi:acyltransferase [Cedecea neteri]|uniref:acyltransferase family protein n=1 Tax=Cedecea neteri TaxID=158822 RepID=UPI0005D93A8F|nr:acyltransferase [Cedecea neteri]AJZ90143.1 acyltransferase [Klebsiella michiganensis]WPU24695.1 acyltransferase [Cedecea neteri]